MPRPRRPLWLRLILITLITGACCIAVLVGAILGIVILWQQPVFQGWFFQFQLQSQLAAAPAPPESSDNPYTGPVLQVAEVRIAKELFQPTNIWEGRLRFSAQQWKTLGPRRVPPLRDWLRPDGTPVLRNPHASRAGVAGVFGYDMPWSSANFEFGSLSFTNVATRYKGNGTFLSGLQSYRRPFKLDLNKNVKGQTLVGRDVLNLHNLEADPSFLSDTLGYEFFRDAGVPAPRTTFLRLYLAIEDQWEDRLLGLYLMVENPDEDWLEEWFAPTNVVLFKPSTPELFADLGNAWESYAEPYEPKTDLTDFHKQRLMELCRLTTHAPDEEFHQRIGEFIDLDEFATFMACVSLMSNYDSILDNGQNFLMWLDSNSGRFGFSPWDLDHSWGEFPWAGTPEGRERASLFHPWIGKKRFLERIFAAPDFDGRYRRELERLLESVFVPERLHARIDTLAAVIRPAVAEQSSRRLDRFEHAIANPDAPSASGATADEAGSSRRRRRHGHQLKHFISVRAVEARAQLAGQSEGVILNRGR